MNKKELNLAIEELKVVRDCLDGEFMKSSELKELGKDIEKIIEKLEEIKYHEQKGTQGSR